MGQEFGSDGKLIKYSNLFSYNSLEELQASTWLPTPRKIKINADKNAAEFNIDKQLSYLSSIYNLDDSASRALKIRLEADLIIDIYNYLDTLQESSRKSINLTYTDGYKDVAQNVIKDIITHERTVIAPNLEESAYKNSVSSNIKNIVQDLDNMVMAYLPINMDDLGQLAGESEKGAMTASMSLMNPLTKYIMLVQNMVGKKVIGITAVGEKVFFNLSYYYNEGVRSGSEEWIRNMQFSKKFDRILNRYNAAHGRGTVESAIKTSLANVNFLGYDSIRKNFISTALIDDAIRKEYGITDLDIENKTDLWGAYSSRLQEVMSNPELQLQYGVTDSAPVDLLISQLLSAATDNAKELILSKINAGDNLAKCHLYLLMLGFDIKDVVTFMTTPYVNLVNDLSESNMMDNYMSDVSIKDAINLSQGILLPSNFLFGTKEINDEYNGLVVKTREELVFANLKASDLYKVLLEDLKLQNPNATHIGSLSKLIQLYILRRVNGLEMKRFAEYSILFEYETRKQVNSLSDYIDKLTYQIQKAQSKYKDKNDFLLDLEEFQKILKLADETSTLGGPFLGLNQGLPSSKEDLLKSIRKIKDAVTTREKEFGLDSGVFDPPIKKSRNPDKAIKAKLKRYESLIANIIENNPFLLDKLDYVQLTIARAHAFGLIGGFDFEAWINDKVLTKNDIKNKILISNDISNQLGYIPRVEIQEYYYDRASVEADTDRIYLFGDNTNDRLVTHHVPTSTLAIIRGLSNAIGIDTKKNRGISDNSYFTDEDFDIFKELVDLAIAYALKQNKTIVIPKDGIGTGKALLLERALKCFAYLLSKLNELKNLGPIKDNVKISYRTLVSDYYNLIKGTWNIFDIINKVPQYKSILNLYSFVYTMDKNTSTRSYLINSIYDSIKGHYKYVDDRLIKTISTYANDLLITSFLRDHNYSFPVYEDMEYLDSKYVNTVAKHGLLIDLNTAPGRASFKKVFEGIISQLQKTGKYGDTVIPDYQNNKLLQDISTVYDKDGTPRLSLELDMMKLNATPNSLKVFLQYLNGLEQLKTININGVSFTDWLILYNLFVNLNQYGSDRFTTIFKNSLVNSLSVLTDYFTYIGNLDYLKLDSDLLKQLDFNIEDLLIRMAPTISQSLESFARDPYIKVRTRSGEIVVKKKNRKGYYNIISTFPDNDMLDPDLIEDQKYNYKIYQMIKMKNLDFNSSLRTGLQSNNIDTLVDTLSIYAQRGLLRIFKENC